ncbi:unnamed protein product, partial [Coregonus sp. 'balchen']
MVARHAGLSEEAEVTLEVNPTPIGSSKLENFLHAGVNRFSIGVQSLRDDNLKVLGRGHYTQHALQTVAEALPGVASWELELDELLSVCDDHVSLYQLTLERGMRILQNRGYLQYEVSNFARNVILVNQNIDGITHQHCQLFSPRADLHQILSSSSEVQDLQQTGLLILDD